MIYEEVSRIRSLRDRIKTKLASLGIINSVTPGDPEPESGGVRSSVTLSDCTTAIENIGSTQNINTTALVNVAAKTGARIDPSVDSVLVANNIKRDVTILGVSGSYSTNDEPDLQHPYYHYGGTGNLSQISPTIHTSPKGYGDIRMFEAESDKTLLPANIRKGVKIMGVVGNYIKVKDYFYKGAYGNATMSPSGNDSVKLPTRFPLKAYKSYTSGNQLYNWQSLLPYSAAPSVSDIQQGNIVADTSDNAVVDGQEFHVITYWHYTEDYGYESYDIYNSQFYCRILGIWFGQSKTEYPNNTVKYCKVVTAIRLYVGCGGAGFEYEGGTQYVALTGINTYTLELPYFPFSIQTEDGQPTSQAMFKIDSNGLAYIKSQIEEQVVVDINNKITDDAKARGIIDSNGNYSRQVMYLDSVQFDDRMFWATDWIVNLRW